MVMPTDAPPSGLMPSSSTMKPPKMRKVTDGEPLERELDDAESDKPAPVEAKKEQTAKTEKFLPESIRELRRGENQELVDYLQALKGTAAIQIAIHRDKPQMFKGKNLKGHIETIEEPIGEDELRDRYGGGQYTLKIKRRNDQGSWVFLTSQTVSVSGDPRVDNIAGAETSSGSQAQAMETGLAQQALTMMERQVGNMRDELKSRDGGMDKGVIDALMKPFELQIRAMQDEAKRKDEQMRAIMDKPSDPFQQKLLEKFVDGDQARVTALRSQYESEIRVIKENHQGDLKRLEDRHERLVSDLRRDSERQIDSQKNAYERELASIKALHSQLDVANTSSTAIIKSSMDRDLGRLEKELIELKTENKTLRETKNQSLLDKVKEVKDFKEALSDDDDSGNANKSTVERILDTALQSDQLLGLAGKWLGPKEAAPAAPARAQQHALPQTPPMYVKQKSTGKIGKWNPATQQYEEVQRRGAGGTGSEDLPQIPPEQLQMAITILERAYANKVPPRNFAATITTALPPEIFQAIRDQGVDGFVNKVAKLGASSPLRRQDGINWLREVGKVLIGDDSPEQDDDGTEPDDLDDAPEDDLLT